MNGRRKQFLPLVALLALVGLGIGIAWFVLHGDGTPGSTTTARADPAAETQPASDLPPAAEVTEVPVEPTATDEAFEESMDQAERVSLRPRAKETPTGPAYPLTGRVIDDRSEEPVYYFSLYLIPTTEGDPMVAKKTWTPSRGTKGEFHLDRQPAGIYHLVVESREHEPVTRTIEIPYDGRLEVRLHHGSCIRGVVRDGFQTPIQGIDIELGVDLKKIDPGSAPPTQRIVKTDDLGRYSFWKVPAGTYSLKARLLGDELASEPEFRLDVGGEVLRDFTLARNAALKVTVTNIAEQPVARARVLLVREVEGRDRPVRTTYSDLKGVARLDFLQQGSYKLKVTLQGFETHEEPVAVAAGEGFRELPVRLQVAAR